MTIDTKFITFKINDTQSIIIKNLCYEGGHFYRWDPIEIVFKDKNNEYIINQHDHLMPKLEDIYYYLLEAIENKLPLSDSINADLGYLRNQYFHHSSITPYQQIQKEGDWEIPRYIMWGGNKFETWLYNQHNKIYLHIITLYEWHYRKTKSKKFVPFDEWIENYKPLAVIEIDKKMAQQWLQQTKIIMKEIKKSDKKYLHIPQDEIED